MVQHCARNQNRNSKFMEMLEDEIFFFSVELLGTDGELMRQRCWDSVFQLFFLIVFPICSQLLHVQYRAVSIFQHS